MAIISETEHTKENRKPFQLTMANSFCFCFHSINLFFSPVYIAINERGDLQQRGGKRRKNNKSFLIWKNTKEEGGVEKKRFLIRHVESLPFFFLLQHWLRTCTCFSINLKHSLRDDYLSSLTQCWSSVPTTERTLKKPIESKWDASCVKASLSLWLVKVRIFPFSFSSHLNCPYRLV